MGLFAGPLLDGSPFVQVSGCLSVSNMSSLQGTGGAFSQWGHALSERRMACSATPFEPLSSGFFEWKPWGRHRRRSHATTCPSLRERTEPLTGSCSEEEPRSTAIVSAPRAFPKNRVVPRNRPKSIDRCRL